MLGIGWNSTVTAGTGLPSSTAVNFQGTLGNWLQLELPYKIYLNQFKFESRIPQAQSPEEMPGSGIVYGSNDEVNWDVVHSFSGVNYGGATGTIRPLFTVNSTTSYSIYRLLVTANYLPQSTYRSYRRVASLRHPRNHHKVLDPPRWGTDPHKVPKCPRGLGRLWH
jgi:hypothetical protein